MQTLAKLIATSRYISWVNTAYPFAAGYLLLGGSIDVIFIVGTLYFLFPYNLFLYGINDVFDYESDIRNPRKGGIEGAVTEKRFHATILWSILALNVPFVAALIVLGTPLSTGTLALVLFFVAAYSAPKLRFKERPLLDSITSSLHFVGPLLFAVALVSTITPAATVACIAFFLWGMASHALGAIQDITADREAGIGSIATVFGARITLIVTAVLYLAALALIGSLGGSALIIAGAGLLYVMNLLPHLSVTDRTAPGVHAAWRRFVWLNYVVGAVVTMVLLYSALY